MIPGTTERRNQTCASAKKLSLRLKRPCAETREAVNTLRGNLQINGREIKLIAVTGVQPDDGKPSIAFWLAESMANLKGQNLYLDCDIRNSIKKSRDMKDRKSAGLTEYLSGAAGLVDIIHRADDSGLDMIFAGGEAPDPGSLLSGSKFHMLLKQARARYDHVIIETPPVNTAIDAALIASRCDGTVLVIESGETDRDQARGAKLQLEFSGAKILGAVLRKRKRGKHP